MMVIYLILCSKKVQESPYIRLKNQANQPGAKQLYQEQRTVHKSFPNPSHTPPFQKQKKISQKYHVSPLSVQWSPENSRNPDPETSQNARIIADDEKKRRETRKKGEKKKKEKKNLMDACTHDRDRASSARERGEAIRYPGNRCPGPVVA